MLKDLKKLSGMNVDEIILQCQDEFDRGDRFMSPLRAAFDEEDRLFRNEKKKKDKLGDFTYYSVYAALMARSYVNRPEASVEETIANKEIASKLNNVIKQDYEDTKMEVIKYHRDSYKFKRGVGIVCKYGWDGEEKRGMFMNIPTELWIPDPDGDHILGDYSFTGFFASVYKNQLQDLNGREKINFDELDNSIELNGARDMKRKAARKAGATADGQSKTSLHNPCYDIYYHYSYFNGVPAMIMMANERSVILKVKILPAITKAQKQDRSRIKFPFAFTYWVPDGTPTGMRVPTFTADPQKAKAIMANLRLEKEMMELYPTYIRNSKILPNKGDIEFGFNKIIDANPLDGQSVKDALIPVAKDFKSDNSFIIENSIDRGVASTTSIDKIAKGSSPDRREGVGTNQLIQDNTDINLALAEKVEAWGEKQLLRLIIQAYQEDFTDGDSKTVSIKTGYGLVSMTLKRKDFLSEDTFNIRVVTKTDLNNENEKKKLAIGNAIGMIQTLPISESSKKFLYRYYFELIGMGKEEAERVVDYTPDEIQAIANAELLNEGVYLEVSMDYDPIVHLTALKSVREGLNKDLYKRGLMKLYKIKGSQNQTQIGGNEAMANNMAAQSSSNIANQMQSL